jgi:hypothetical protein
MTKHTNLQAGRPSSRRNEGVSLASISKSSGSTKRVNFDLSVELHQKLRRYAFDNDKSLKEVMTDFVESLPG